MHTKGVQRFLDQRYNVIELVDALARHMAGGNNFHAVELPHVEIMNVQNAVDLLDLLEKRVGVDVVGNELHDDFGHTDELGDGRV